MECADLRILFAGNPAIAVPALEAVARSFHVVGVLTNPDKPTGRGRHLEMPPVKEKALELGIPVLQYDRLLGESREKVASLRPNFLLSFACGHYFGPKFLALFPEGNANIHPSLLPKYRGCAPLQFTVLNGESETGITIQRIVAEIDSGEILAQKILPLDGTETTASLSDRVAAEAADLIIRTLAKLCEGRIEGRIQSGEPSYTRMLSKSDGVIDWNESARSIHCKVRAMNPWPKASTTFCGTQLSIASVWGDAQHAGEEFSPPCLVPGTVVGLTKGKGLAVVCGDGLLYVTRLQLAQKKEMDSSAFVNGNPRIIGAVLGS